MKQYIEKTALMDHVEREARRWGFDYDYEQILGDIEDFQTADVRPVVRGRWVRNNGRWCCDKCTCQAVAIRSPFCPNCGADMREDQP